MFKILCPWLVFFFGNRKRTKQRNMLQSTKRLGNDAYHNFNKWVEGMGRRRVKHGGVAE